VSTISSNSKPLSITGDTGILSSITISGGSSNVIAGTLAPAFTAIAYDAYGNALMNQPIFIWSATARNGTATITSGGIATGNKVGIVIISANSYTIVSNKLTLNVTKDSGIMCSISIISGSSTVSFVAVAYDVYGNVLTMQP
jgi:hypothetical protein